jgi:hypothetical protein
MDTSATVTHWLPTKPPRPAPTILSAEEAVILLRIDTSGVKNPEKTLEYYRRSMNLPGRLVGRNIVYLLDELLEWVRNTAKDGPKPK